MSEKLNKLYDWKKSFDKQVEDNLVYVADFETSTNNCLGYKKQKEQDANFNDSRITYGYAKMLNPDEHKNKFDVEREGTTPQSFKDFLQSLKKDTTIYFHNLTYDGRFIIKSIIERGHRKNLEPDGKIHKQITPLQIPRMVEENGIFKMIGYVKREDGKGYEIDKNHYHGFHSGKTIYKIEMKIRNKQRNYINITFRCSLQILKSSVNNLGKGLSSMKGYEHLVKYKAGQDTKEFYDVEPMDDLEAFKQKYPDYVEYCKRDVEIVRVSIHLFNQTMSELPTIKNYLKKHNRTHYNAFRQAITIAGLGRHIMGGQYVKIFQQGYLIDEQGNKTFNKEQYDRYNRTNLITKERPIGSMILQNFQEHYFFKDKIYYEDDENGSSNFYLGGFTQFNKKLQPKDGEFKEIELLDGIKLDVKSAYPFQMTKPMPYGCIMNQKQFKRLYLNKNKHGKQGEDYIEWLVIRCNKITPSPDAIYCPILPNTYKHDRTSKYFGERYMTGEQDKVVICACKALWEEYQLGYDFEIDSIEKYYQLAAPYLKPIALELYNVKEYVYGKKDDKGNKLFPAQQNCVKVLVNSLYGSLAMKPDYCDNVVVDNDLFEYLLNNKDEKHMVESNGKLKEFEYIGETCAFANDEFKEVRLEMEIDEEQKQCFNASAPALITQYERLYLFQAIRTIGAKYFAYSDTDSIVFYNFPPEIRKKILELAEIKPLAHLNTNLGQGEIENYYIKSFKADKAKQYFYTIYKTNSKGDLLNKNNEIVYDKKDADIIKGNKVAGGTLDGVDKQFIMEINKQEAKYGTGENYQKTWEELGVEVSKDDYEQFKKGSLVLFHGDRFMERTPSGWLLKIKKKIIQKGKQ